MPWGMSPQGARLVRIPIGMAAAAHDTHLCARWGEFAAPSAPRAGGAPCRPMCCEASLHKVIDTYPAEEHMNSAHQLVPVMGVTLGLAFGSAVAAANAVTDWHINMESAVVVTGKKNPNAAIVYFAYADVAMYDAVNSIDGRFQPFAVRVDAPRDASKDAAASVAAHDVLVHYLPLQQATLDADLQASLNAIADRPAKTAGINVGHAVAAQWLALRSGDGVEAPVSLPEPAPGPGIWEPVPTFPSPNPITPPPVAEWQALFKPFALLSADQFLELVPPPDEHGLHQRFQSDEGLWRPQQQRAHRAADRDRPVLV